MVDPMVSPAGMRVIRLLVGKPPQTVADLVKAVGVTRTAITDQLNELAAAGLVEREAQRLKGRGRPRHVYRTTSDCLPLLFANSKNLLVPAIWKAIEAIGEETLTRKVVQRVSSELANHYKRKITARSPEGRLRQLCKLLCEEGGLMEAVRRNGKLQMRKRSCPFIGMIDSKRTVCCVDLEMMTKVVGRPVRLVACRHEGDPCCVVEIASDKQSRR